VIIELAHTAVAYAPALDPVVNIAARAILADDSTGDDSGESKKSGPLGLVIIIALCVGCYFLFKSMSKHLRHVREDFPAAEGAARSDVTGSQPRAVVVPVVKPVVIASERPADPGSSSSG